MAFEFIRPEFSINIEKYTPLKVVFDGNLMVYMFCVLSGYLICRSRITTVKDVIVKSIMRYLRFSLPIFVAYVLTYIMGMIWGFGVRDIPQMVGDYSLTGYYSQTITLKQIFYGPFIGIWIDGSTVIPVLWMIRYLLYASVIIYLYQYLTARFEKYTVQISILFILIIMVIDIDTWLVFATFLGVMIYRIKQSGKIKMNRWINAICIIAIIVLNWFGHELIFNLISRFIHLPQMLNYNGHMKAVYMALLVWCMINSEIVKKVFSSKILVRAGRESFAIFLLHVPLICSFSMWIYLRMYDTGINSGVLYYMIIIVTFVMLTVIAVLFRKYIEKGINKLLAKLQNSIK